MSPSSSHHIFLDSLLWDESLALWLLPGQAFTLSYHSFILSACELVVAFVSLVECKVTATVQVD